MARKKAPHLRCLFQTSLIETTFLPGCFCFLLALNARFLVMFALPSLRKHTRSLTLTFKTAQSAVQRLVFADPYLGHLVLPPSATEKMLGVLLRLAVLAMPRGQCYRNEPSAIIPSGPYDCQPKVALSCLPPITCTCKCGTACPPSLPTLMTTR